MLTMRKQLKLTAAPSQPIVIGKIGAAYGISGWIKVFSFTESIESIFSYQPWLVRHISTQWQLIELENWKRHSNGLIINITGINNRNLARALTHREIIVDSKHFPLLARDEYYWKDIIGCQVITTTSYDLGKVVDIMETGSNDVIVIKSNARDSFGTKERLVPFLCEEVIKRVDTAAQVIEVDWDPSF